MARAHFVAKAARKWSASETGIDGGIKKGAPYYWWKFKRGGKRFSLTPPRRSQLTQSSFYATLFNIEDDSIAKATTETIADDIQNIAQEIRDLGDECQQSLDNMPEGLQQGSTGELLSERVQWCEDKAQEVESIDTDDAESAVEELQGLDLTDAP